MWGRDKNVHFLSWEIAHYDCRNVFLILQLKYLALWKNISNQRNVILLNTKVFISYPTDHIYFAELSKYTNSVCGSFFLVCSFIVLLPLQKYWNFATKTQTSYKLLFWSGWVGWWVGGEVENKAKLNSIEIKIASWSWAWQ